MTMTIEKIDPNLFRINGIEIEAADEQDAIKRFADQLEKQVKSLTIKSHKLRADNERYRARLGRKRLTPRAAAAQMRALVKEFGNDPEAFHGKADDFLCKLLKSCGYDLVVSTYKQQKKY